MVKVACFLRIHADNLNWFQNRNVLRLIFLKTLVFHCEFIFIYKNWNRSSSNFIVVKDSAVMFKFSSWMLIENFFIVPILHKDELCFVVISVIVFTFCFFLLICLLFYYQCAHSLFSYVYSSQERIHEIHNTNQLTTTKERFDTLLYFSRYFFYSGSNFNLSILITLFSAYFRRQVFVFQAKEEKEGVV